MAKESNLAELQIVYRKLSDMHPNPKNPRKQGDDGIVPLAESIEKNPQFFIARPILLSDRTGELVIIGGERRWEAAQYLEMEKAPSILISGLTEEQEDEIMVRDNTHDGIWDDAKIAEIAAEWGGDKVKKWTPNVNWIEPQVTRVSFIEALPEELRGKDLQESELPVLEGSDERKRERVIITYPKERENEIAAMLGIPSIGKIVYRIEELNLIRE